MKSYISKAAVVCCLGLMTASSAAFGGIIGDAKDAASDSWTFAKDVTRSVVYSPVTAYHVVRGDRPLFLHHDRDTRESVAYTGHRHSDTVTEQHRHTYHGS